MCVQHGHIWFEPESGIGRRIRHRRWMLGMSQQRFAGKIGVAPDLVEAIESDARAFRIGELSTIAIALDVQISYFLDGAHGSARERHAPPLRIVVDPSAAAPTDQRAPAREATTEIFAA